jgi:hypothetical protein
LQQPESLSPAGQSANVAAAGVSQPSRTDTVRKPSLSDEHRATPERSLDQRRDALNRANEVRALRAQLKRELKTGRVSMGALLRDPPPYLETAKVFDMLLALPKYGSAKAAKLLHGCRVSPSKRLGGLRARQRMELAGRLDQ